jgi:hypothetical protein
MVHQHNNEEVNLMKSLKLYKIEPHGLPAMHVAARSDRQAAQVFITYEASLGRAPDRFVVDLVSMEALDAEQRTQLQSLLAVSTEGIATFDSDTGWSIDSDGWTSFDSEEVR